MPSSDASSRRDSVAALCQVCQKPRDVAPPTAQPLGMTVRVYWLVVCRPIGLSPGDLPGAVVTLWVGARSMKAQVKAIGTLLAVLGLGACSSDPDEASRGDSLLEAIGNADIDYVPLTASEMVAESSLIVRGHLTGVRDGRVVDFAEGASNPVAMAVVEVSVTDVIKGAVTDRAHFEFIRGGLEVEQIDEEMPAEEVLLFLAQPGWNADTYRFEHPRRGLPDGATLFALRTPQALLLEAGGRAYQPLEPGTSYQMFEPIPLDDVELEVRTLSADPAP
jgi:hypothetical protein